MRLLFWGTYDLGKPRIRILQRGLRENGVEVLERHADIWRGIEDKSAIASWPARLVRFARWICAYPRLLLLYLAAPRHDAVVVGYPGYLDILVLWPFARLRRRPILWDAFMSLYGTAVEDRRLAKPGRPMARLLSAMEWLACRAAAGVVLDTGAHAQYFVRRYRLPPSHVAPVFVGAEPEIFPPQPADPAGPPRGSRPTVLFYGQFIPLHGIETIMRAALRPDGGDFDWVLIGAGQEAAKIRSLAGDRLPDHIRWIPWVDYGQLKDWVHKADLCLGIFGDTDKAARVIPNKVFQALSAGKPLITRDSPAIRELLNGDMEGVYLVPPADPDALLAALRAFASAREMLLARLPLHRAIADCITPRAIGHAFRQLAARVVHEAGTAPPVPHR